MIFLLKMLIEDRSVFIADGTGNHVDRQRRIQQQFTASCIQISQIYAESDGYESSVTKAFQKNGNEPRLSQ